MSEQNVENQEKLLTDSFKKRRGVGITRKNKELSKSKLRIQKNSRKINRNKKRHHMTRKEKKAR